MKSNVKLFFGNKSDGITKSTDKFVGIDPVTDIQNKNEKLSNNS